MGETYYLGDLCNNFGIIVNFCRRNDKMVPKAIIQVGNFGAGFYKDFKDDMEYLNDMLSSFNVTLYSIRGNHDNPIFFKGDHKWSNLKLLPDYTVENINGENILFIGGGISIDRQKRINGYDYWKNEIVIEDIEKLEILHDIDIVATHTSPSFVRPTSLSPLEMSYSTTDLTLLEDLKREKDRMDKIYNILISNNNIKKWVYGHYLDEYTEIHENTAFHLLNKNKIYSL